MMNLHTMMLAVWLLFFVGSPETGYANINERFEGKVVSAESGEPIAGATVLIRERDRGAAADADGQFTIRNLDSGSYTLIVRAVGFSEKTVEVSIPTEEKLTIELTPEIIRADDVIVTGSPFGRNLQYQAAQGYNNRDLQEMQAPSFGEMLDGEPGIAMRSFGPAPSRPVIRGFDGDRLLVLENGERMGDLSNTAHDHNISLDPLVAERVEVVRGPASLLYGSSALGGVVNILTSDIPRDWSRGASGTAVAEASSMNDGIGSYARYQQGWDNTAVTSRLSYRGAGDVRTPAGRLAGTFIQNIEGGAGIGYSSDNFSGGASISLIDHNYGLPEGLDDPDEEAEIAMNQQTFQLRGVWSLDNFVEEIELRANAARLYQQEIETEFAGSDVIDQDIELEFLQYSANSTLTLRHRTGEFFDEGVVGLSTRLSGLDVGGDEVFTPGSNSRSIALFTFHEIPLHSSTMLQFGVRGETRTFNTRSNDEFQDLEETRNNRAISGSVGLNIRPGGGIEIGAQLARAHRFPILEELYAEGVHFGAGVYERGDSSLGTELGHGTDLFLKWSRSRLKAEVAGFYYRISDYVAFEPTGDIFIDDRNREWDVFEYRARDAELLGGEAQISYLVTDQLRAGGSVDYVRGTRLDNGSPLPTMPPLRYRFNTRYDTGRWWVGGSVRMVNRQDRLVAEEMPTDGYTLINLNSGFNFGRDNAHRVSVVVDNLTNELYRDHLSRVDRTEFGSPMPERNFRVSYRVDF